MAKIEFHFNAPALVAYTCRLLRKVNARGLRAQVVGHSSTLAQLDQALWTFSQLDFLTHCVPNAPAPMRKTSAVLLAPQPDLQWHRQILINLGDAVPAGFEDFERIIDVVSVDDLHRAQGRERWRQYSRLGHELVRHDLSQPAPAGAA
jgi:DNA polymerase-3 subunit chi